MSEPPEMGRAETRVSNGARLGERRVRAVRRHSPKHLYRITEGAHSILRAQGSPGTVYCRTTDRCRRLRRVGSDGYLCGNQCSQEASWRGIERATKSMRVRL